jgi:Mn2+/Fe2+ NRAMP family transporter
MTVEQWIVFILFTIVINIVIQVLAWKIGYWLGTKQDTEAENDYFRWCSEVNNKERDT